MTEQLCFSFDGEEPRVVSGVEIWRERRRAEIDRLSRGIGAEQAGRFSKGIC